MQSMKFLSQVIIGSILIYSTSVHAKFQLFKKNTQAQAIPVFETKTYDKPFVVLGKVQTQGVHTNQLISKIRKKAFKNKADVVLGFRSISCNELPQISNILIGKIDWPCAEGYLVIFSDDGILEITDKTPVPILE
jgi:hypothetical protein